MSMIDRAWTHNDYTDYMSLTKLDRSNTLQVHSQTGKYARGTMESVYWSHRGENLYIKWNKIWTKYKDKISFKNDTKRIIYTHHMSDRPIQSMKIYAYGSSGNTHPLKSWQELTVDVPSPNKSNIYLCAVMSHDTIKCPAVSSHTKQHKTNTCIQKCDSSLYGITYSKILHS